MNRSTLASGLALFTFVQLVIAQLDIDPARIGVYVTPYYNSEGPVIDVGRFSSGLASKAEKDFVATIVMMREHWAHLSFPELYVGAIRLFDLGYRQEAVFWFYTAQYRGRQFGYLMDESKVGRLGDPGFELLHAHSSFMELVGIFINGYAFGDIHGLINIIEEVQEEARDIPDLQTVYPRVAFKPKSEWRNANDELAKGMTKFVAYLEEHKTDITRERVERGVEAQFSALPSKEFPIPRARLAVKGTSAPSQHLQGDASVSSVLMRLPWWLFLASGMACLAAATGLVLYLIVYLRRTTK